MPETVDLDAYFSRIGYLGPRKPTLETLKALHGLHPQAIAFENLDALLSRRVRLDLAAIQRKLIHERRGGYCYEHNGLFAAVLTQLGFKVAGLAARVIFNHPPHMLRRSHMLLKLDLAGEIYIADVGFGGRSLSAPLRLYDERVQETPHGPFRIVRSGDFFEQQAPAGGPWTTLYRFSLEEQMAQDYEMANWYVQTHPDSEFRVRLMAARLPPRKRLALLNNQFTVYHADGSTERQALKSAEAIAHVLETDFAIALPEPRDEVLAVLQKVIPASD